MQNVLVTGGCGFIGSNFIYHLLGRDDFSGQVINVDNLTYAGNPDNLASLTGPQQARYHFIKADIGDTDVMAGLLADHQVDAVCHFAAESHVDRSIAGPAAFVSANVVGTFSLLEAARKHGGGRVRFHHVSTDEVYGSLGDTGAFVESTPYRPNSPYAATKAGSDHLVRAYAHTYGLPVTISNCSNNYGPYQFPEKLIPLMILNALERKPLPVYGKGENTRDWLFVEDHCRAVWDIMTRGVPGETYNVGGGCEKRNLEVVHTVCDIIDELAPAADGRPSRDLVTFVQDRPGHDWRYAIDFTKLRRNLGWSPRESFETGIRKTVRWYLDHMDWVDRVRTGDYRDWIRQHYGDG